MFCSLQSPKKILCVFRLLRRKLLWQDRRRRKLSNENNLERKRKLPKRRRKIGLEKSAKQMMMMRVNGDKKRKKVKRKIKKKEFQSFGHRCLPAVKGRWGGAITALRGAVFSGALFPRKSSLCHEVKARQNVFLARSECFKKNYYGF